MARKGPQKVASLVGGCQTSLRIFIKRFSFFGNKTVNQCSGANLKNVFFFAKICFKFLAFLKCFAQKVFCTKSVLHKKCFAQKVLKMTISTSVWSAQHPNAGRNIQQLTNYGWGDNRLGFDSGIAPHCLEQLDSLRN